jgi:hypothetical protein
MAQAPIRLRDRGFQQKRCLNITLLALAAADNDNLALARIC